MAPTPPPDELSAAQIASLATAAAYPHDPQAAASVGWIQTHLSHVFLTPGFVYKLRKRVNPAFLDFSGRAERNADCLREVALNARFSPDVYLGVAPVRAVGERAEVGALQASLAPGCEHVVVMRRLPAGRDALSLWERGALGAAEIDAIAARIAALHAAHGLGAPTPFAPAVWQARCAEPMRANVASLAEAARAGVVAAAAAHALGVATEAALARHAPPLEARRARGCAVDGHGDLHLQHVWLEPGAGAPRVTLIDCIEFNDAWRQIDAASEVAFLAMDLRYRGARSLGERFLRRYAAQRDDFDLYRVVDFFAAYRAAVRAKVAALAAGDAAIAAAQRAGARESAQRHLALALELLLEPAPGALVVVCGSVGTGKSTVAQRLADEAAGVVIASDRTRKALAGVAPADRGGARAGAALYADAMTERTYAGVLERAGPVVGSGRVAILDATFARAARRDAALAFARAEGARAWLVEVRCSEDVARARVAARAARGDDPSDAGPERVAPSRAAFEPTDGWPAGQRTVVETDRAGWEGGVAALATQLRG